MNSKLAYLMITGGVVALTGAAAFPRNGTDARMDGRAPHVVTITATDYAFQAPDTVESGATTLRLVNKGKELHHVFLIRLEQGKRLADVGAAMQSDGPMPAWAVPAGGPNAPAPGGESAATVELKPGRYAMICVIPSPDGKPHVMKGMSRELVVVPSKTATEMPKADITVTLKDYGFAFSKPLTAGKHEVLIVNEAEQPHEIVIAQLGPGKTAGELAAWLEKQAGPPPGKPYGGTVALAKGESNIIPLDVAPGDYALICFVPDAGDGKPHIAHGMLQQITVK